MFLHVDVLLELWQSLWWKAGAEQCAQGKSLDFASRTEVGVEGVGQPKV